MLAILDILNRSTPTVLLTMILILLTFGVALGVVILQHRMFKKRLKVLLTGSSSQNLETLLYDILRERIATEDRLEELGKRVDSLDKRMTTCQRFIGLVRYDAFGDVGGHQSFALAIYDEKGDGAVISSLVGRTDCRVYCKTLSRGKSDRDLGKEELEAIDLAATKRSKALITG